MSCVVNHLDEYSVGNGSMNPNRACSPDYMSDNAGRLVGSCQSTRYENSYQPTAAMYNCPTRNASAND